MIQQLHSLLKGCILICCSLFLFLGANAQGFTLRGKVVDAASKSPIAAASLFIKSSSKSAISDANGEFSIAAQKGDVIMVTYVGYDEQQVKVTGSDYLQIALSVGNSQLNDVVVTALGIRKETKRLGYSVQEVKGSDLLKARESNPVNGLVGKVAGLNVGINQELLASPTVLLRGSPLNFYVVDGIPINSDTWNISPDDIETYTVLKGPTAAALYGSRGINGAILITTKRGKKNNKGFTVEVNSSTQINKGFIAIPKVQNQYGGGDNQKYAFGDYNSNGSGSGVNDKDYDVWGPRLDAGLLLPQYDGPYDPTQNYVTTFANGQTYTGHIQPTPWVARGKNNLENFLQAGLLTTNNVNFSTANDRSSVRMSVSNTHQTGITPNTQLNAINFNILGSYDVTDKFKVEGSLNYNRQFTPNIPDAVYGPNSIIYNIDVWTGADWNVLDPNIVNYWQPGKEGIQSNFVEYKRYHNPYFSSYEWLRSHYKNDIYGWGALTYKFNKSLDVMLRSNVTTYNVLRSEKLPFSAHPYGDEHNHGNYREDRRDLWENNTDLIVRFNKENVANSGFSLSAFGGGTARSMKFTSSYVSTDQLIIPNVYTFANTLKPIRAYSYGSNLLMLSAYYSVDLTYKKYFTVSTTGRVDKTSALPVGHNSGFYPSVTLSSALSDYISLPKAISFLKVRGSYANVKGGGASSYVGTAFQSLGVGSPVGYGNNYFTPYDGPSFGLSTPPYATYPGYNNQTQASSPNYVINTDIKPSSRSNYEFGFDARFLKNRVGLNATYFQYKDGPNISNQSLSETSGLGYFTTNGGATKRTGGEISITGTPVQTKNGLTWDVLVNWASYKEVFTAFAGGVTEVSNGTGYPYHIGDRVDQLFGSYEALTPDGKVIHDESGFPMYLPKAQYLGHADPDWSWGINNKFSYKSFSFSFQFDGMVGGKIQDRVLRKLTEGGRGQNTVEGVIGDARLYESQHWGDAGYAGAYNADGSPMLGNDGVQISNGASIQYDPVTGVITNYKDLQFAPNATATQWIQDYVSSFYNDPQHTMVSKTYAKLRQVVITYSLPSKVLGKSFINKVDISLVGRNLLYFFPKAFHDIDVDQYPGRTLFGGINREYDLQTPTTRSYGININVVF
ncbi:SusC/RagA family TonB-linked outer membrane protein [Limnovirga soli]|uniref:SusC/RagA family TonB-linked outer membrane protein n=1 Tax=Limnovirga soli TaxID=2656915 RepID=A0A8J8FDN9_9BACT|nr:SusC/RagA family TonB-linked outer membrane protein [Limnovirga soli]NNV55602.1 SusC/RagA family TonB-linked outer membrane protein [Limnovirga soli]